MQQFIPFLAVGVFILLAWVAIKAAKRQLLEQEKTLQQLGFAKADVADPLVQGELQGLVGRRKQGAALSRIFRYSASGYDLYRFDIRHGKETDTGNMALVLHQQRLPALSIAPRIELPGIFGKLVNRLIETVISKAGAEEVALPEYPQFAKKYRVFARGGRTAIGLLPPVVWERISALPGQLLMDIDGRVISIQEMVTNTRKRGTRGGLRHDLQNMLSLADQVYSCFREARSAVTA